MTNEQDNKLSERVRKYTETFKDHPASVDFEMGKIAGFVKGVKDVVNNPGEYGLKPQSPLEEFIENEGKRQRKLALSWPTIQEVQDWFTAGQEINEGYWQEEQGFTVGDVFATVLNAFEHFKNRKS